jgi:Zn-dependent protease with chaperone function
VDAVPQVLLILSMMVVIVHDHWTEHPVWYDRIGPWWTLLATLGPMVLIIVIVEAASRVAVARLDRTGQWGSVRGLNVAVTIGRVAALLHLIVSVAWIGWLDLVRDMIGDWPVIDEFVCILPVIVVMLFGWSSAYPMERRLREAILLQELDQGAPITMPPSLCRYIWTQSRHQLLIVLIPMFIIIGWADAGGRLLEMIKAGGGGPSRWVEGDRGQLALMIWQLLGVGVAMLLTPVLIKSLWTTAPVPEGRLRDELHQLMQTAGVRARSLRVWYTDGTLVNGAVIGLVPWSRYVLLTDGLLDALPRSQLRAVMAHEVAHIRLHHLIWLGISAGACVLWILLLLDWGMQSLGAELSSSHAALTTILAGAGAFLLFGWVSRHLEWQADAFAVRLLNGLGPLPRVEEDETSGDEPGRVRSEAIETMVGALRSVARLNGIPEDQAAWRHGSISQRIALLRALEGRPAHDFPIDHKVRLIKLISVLGLAGAIAVLILGPSWTS